MRVPLIGGDREVLAPAIAAGWNPILTDADCICWVAATGLMTIAAPPG